MAAPPFVPVDPVDRPRAYSAPDYVPAPWAGDRPATITGRQPSGTQLGSQGPDQGYGLLLAERMRAKLRLAPGESADDVVRGCLGVALRRASLFGRAPSIHDFTVACTIWGFLDPAPPADLVALRGPLFAGVANTLHHYAEARAIVDLVPDQTLRMQVADVTGAYPARWQALLGR